MKNYTFPHLFVANPPVTNLIINQHVNQSEIDALVNGYIKNALQLVSDDFSNDELEIFTLGLEQSRAIAETVIAKVLFGNPRDKLVH